MSIKRSRKEMTRKAVAAASANNNTMIIKKKVQFSDDITVIAPSTYAAGLEDEEIRSSSPLWYTRLELTEQLEGSKKSIDQWISNGFSILLRNAYGEPHIYVQEYLNAFVSLSELRGLEGSVEVELKNERAATRRSHKEIILAEQQVSLQQSSLLPAAATAEIRWAKLYQCSRQSSASSKLFAMRMGRADACVVYTGENVEAAYEIVAECKQKEENTKRQRQLHNHQLRWSSTSTLPHFSGLEEKLSAPIVHHAMVPCGKVAQ